MNNVETRLREAFRADAETVRPETIRPLPEPGAHARRDQLRWLADGSRRGRILIPLVAAATVAAILAGVAVAAPRIWSGPTPSEPVNAIAAGFPGSAVPKAPLPKFVATIVQSGTGVRLETLSTKTGHVIADVTAPHTRYLSIAADGNDRTFIVATAGPGCSTRLSRLTFSAAGRLQRTRPLQGSALHGHADWQAMAVSADGRFLAVASRNCKVNNGSIKHLGTISLINLRTGTSKGWGFRWPALPTDLSLSADGRMLEFVSNPSNGTRVGSDRLNQVWALRTNSRSGPVEQHYRSVAGSLPTLSGAALSPNGRLTSILTTRHIHKDRTTTTTFTITVIKTESGHQVAKFATTERHAPGQGQLVPDTSGRHVLLFDFSDALRWFDVVHQRIVTIPNGNPAIFRPVSTAW
jgi:hypothetical protein